MNRALIFDCDGTLADTMPTHYQAWLDVLKPHKIPFPEDVFYALGGTPTRKIIQILAERVGKTVSPAVIESVTSLKEAAYLKHLDTIKPIESVVKIAIENFGKVPMAVASGGLRSVVNQTLKQIKVSDLFSIVVTAEDTEKHKPEPDVFLEAARRLGVPPEICTVYEDTDHGVEAARRAGMAFVDVREIL